MDSERPHGSTKPETRFDVTRRTRVPLTRSGRRLSFEIRLRAWLLLLGAPVVMLLWLWMRQRGIELSVQTVILLVMAAAWIWLVSLLMEQIIRPLQTLANLVAALREEDYSFRARGGRRNDAVGDLALEINTLAGRLKERRTSALEAMALLESVMGSMPSPVLAFDPAGRLRLLNAAGERAFLLEQRVVLGRSAAELGLSDLLRAEDDDVIPLGETQQMGRWIVKRTSFRLRGVPHTLLVLSDVSVVLREEERLAWERLIRVLGHEINNSLTPIKSIASSLRGRLDALPSASEDRADFGRGLEVIENRSESLNRFLQAYRQLMRLPAPKLREISLAALIERVAQLEIRVKVEVVRVADSDLTLCIDIDQIEQALINLLRNAAEAAMGPDALGTAAPCVQIGWESTEAEAVLWVLDNGPGLTNEGNLFVPFYTTKPNGTGIGLVLAQQIAQAHHGFVQLANRMDGQRGCRAEMRLPVVSATPRDS